MENAGEDAKETGLSCRWTFVIWGKKQGANGADGGSPASPWGIVLEGRPRVTQPPLLCPAITEVTQQVIADNARRPATGHLNPGPMVVPTTALPLNSLNLPSP